MNRGPGSINEFDGVVIEHLRSSLLRLLVQAQKTNSEPGRLEAEIRHLIEQLDGLQLAFDVSRRQISLPLEPVNVAEVAEGVINKFNKNFSNLGIVINYKKLHKAPILAHRSSLLRSLDSMIHAAVNVSDMNKLKQINIAAIRTSAGVKLGVYSESMNLSSKEYSEFKSGLTTSSRPAAALNPVAAANLYIAETLLSAMGAHFRTATYKSQHGVATVLPYSNQLQLVSL